MRKVQLLAPAGSFEALIAAVSNGADAVYLGSKLFNARRLAANFNVDTLKMAVQYAHLHQVKVYLTLNTLIKNQEMKAFLNQIAIAEQLGIDAVIIQDLSFAPIIKQFFPKIEVHASTQATIMNSPAVQYWQKFVDVFVLARESTKEQVKTIYKKTGAVLEVFVHGHLCISYSGQCLISSLIGSRSGNRGMCASSCRKQYNGEEYLISAKDLCMIENVADVIESGAQCLKIEGRMKPPEYVATTTRYYREQIDAYCEGKQKPVPKAIVNNLKLAFNRNFTKGYFNEEKSIVDPLISSKRGILLGKVKQGKLLLQHDLELYDAVTTVYKGKTEGDFVTLIQKGEQKIHKVSQGDIISLQLPGFKEGATVYLMSQHQGENLLGAVRKIPVCCAVRIRRDHHIEVLIDVQRKKYYKKSDFLAQEATKHLLTKEDIVKELEKWNSAIFQFSSIDVDTDESFVPKSFFTRLRKELDAVLLDLLVPIGKEKKQIPELQFSETSQSMKEIHVRVYSLSAIQEAVRAKATVIYYDAFAADVEEAKELMRNSNGRLFLYTPMVMSDEDCERLRKIVHKVKPEGLLVNNVGVLRLNLSGVEIFLGYQMNIFNDNQLAFYDKDAVASIELTAKELGQFKNKAKLVYYAHGRPVVMTFKEEMKQNRLMDKKGYSFPLRKVPTGGTEMLYSKKIALLQNTPEIIATGITRFYLELEHDVYELIRVYQQLLEGKRVSVSRFQKGVTTGNLVKGVM